MSLEAKQLCLSYGQNLIIDNASITLHPDQFTAIIGPNGSGKSTFLRGLCGALPPSAGEVLFNGKSLSDWRLKELAREMVFLPQSPMAPEGLSLRQVVEHGRYPHQRLFGGNQHNDRAIVDDALAKTGLCDLADRPFSSLSGGERQRGWISLALAQKTSLFLLDEPTTYLDIGHQNQTLDLLKHLNQHENIGVVAVLHDINHALLYADRIIAVLKGRVIADGPPRQIITVDLLARLYGFQATLIDVKLDQIQYRFCVAIPQQRLAHHTALNGVDKALMKVKHQTAGEIQ